MTQCLLVTCQKCGNLMAIKTLDDRTSITLIDDFSCKIEDIAIVNRMPVCNCSDAIKALEGK